MNRTWVVLGATSIIAEKLAHCAAREGHAIILIGRNVKELTIKAADISLRYRVSCEVIATDFSKPIINLLSELYERETELDLIIAHSLMLHNYSLDDVKIADLIQVNILSTAQLIHTYFQKKQSEHHLLFLSSVAASRGRAKNSLYGGSKAAIEVYLQGLQQAATSAQTITIARLGFIDSKTTYGEPGIFYASAPERCAAACWRAIKLKKRQIYHPFFWRFIIFMIRNLPFFIYRKLRV
ncbi:SDR family NAD(P)-dependent oxidoreductase [Legionella septentrionalis]|uniref:SDR family NAD(P)-dependent oxidoreductase n=1 Tax=Legionella septentrionalis TaxID=2498109 RepID=UPI000F8DE195|nr:SDR family NAD(P)-dependent oxidoreductase [Legionella septentrionalis]RUR11774.1 SDR family NAD(P)-dependent oxidoreductase [Legionella septentrionalis]